MKWLRYRSRLAMEIWVGRNEMGETDQPRLAMKNEAGPLGRNEMGKTSD
jgi:hypothetical protein